LSGGWREAEEIAGDSRTISAQNILIPSGA